MPADVIEFPSEHPKTGLDADQINAVKACAYELIERGIITDIEHLQTNHGASYLWLGRDGGDGWVASRECGAYVLYKPDHLPPLISSPNFDALIEVLRGLTR